MLRFIFTAIEKRHGAAKLQQIISETNYVLDKFISDGNFNRWLEANVSFALNENCIDLEILLRSFRNLPPPCGMELVETPT